MIGLWLAIAAAFQSPPQPPVDDIVVIGRKLANTQGAIVTNVLTGKHRCRVEKTSGDARIDTAVCDIAIGCLNARKDGPEFKPCVIAGRERFLAEFSNMSEDTGQ